MFTKKFWRAAAERMLKSTSQGLVLLYFGTTQINALEFDWRTAGGTAIGMAILSVLSSLGSAAITDQPGPSLTDAEVLPQGS